MMCVYIICMRVYIYVCIYIYIYIYTYMCVYVCIVYVYLMCIYKLYIYIYIHNIIYIFICVCVYVYNHHLCPCSRAPGLQRSCFQVAHGSWILSDRWQMTGATGFIKPDSIDSIPNPDSITFPTLIRDDQMAGPKKQEASSHFQILLTWLMRKFSSLVKSLSLAKSLF